MYMLELGFRILLLISAENMWIIIFGLKCLAKTEQLLPAINWKN